MTRLLSAHSLMGDRVVNTAGETLGKIEELMIELASGTVEYAVLATGGFLGMGERLFAIPWHAMAIDLDAKSFVLDADKQFLENAPGFDKEHWPDFADPLFRERHYSYYEVKLATR